MKRFPILPPCVCDATSWEDHGGYFSPDLTQRDYRCASCGKTAAYVEAAGGNVFVVAPSPEHHKYLNEVLLGVWRAAHAAGSEQVPTPPRMPGYMNAYVLRNGGWERIDPRGTRDLPIPPDPIRTRHDERFRKIFERVAEQTGAEISPEETDNRYDNRCSKNEPWFMWEVGDVTVVVGPRKRVISIEASRADGFDVRTLRTLAERDDVTFSAQRSLGSDTIASFVVIHAWSDDLAAEYLVALLRSLRAEVRDTAPEPWAWRVNETGVDEGKSGEWRLLVFSVPSHSTWGYTAWRNNGLAASGDVARRFPVTRDLEWAKRFAEGVVNVLRSMP